MIGHGRADVALAEDDIEQPRRRACLLDDLGQLDLP
jgi:hypothetical protein